MRDASSSVALRILKKGTKTSRRRAYYDNKHLAPVVCVLVSIM